MIKALNPDVITLDVEMPNMNGLEFLEKIMRLRPMPVVMVSTLTQKGADITLAALELGAVDYFPKPTENAAAILEATGQELVAKVKVAAKARVRPLLRPVVGRTVPRISIRATAWSPSAPRPAGVEALLTVLSAFPANCPPTVITQHMPAHFTTLLRRPAVAAVPAEGGRSPGRRAAVRRTGLSGAGRRCPSGSGRPRQPALPADGSALVSGHRPSVDVLFHSVAPAAGAARGRRHPHRHGQRRRPGPDGHAQGRRRAPSARMKPAPSSTACRARPSSAAQWRFSCRWKKSVRKFCVSAGQAVREG